MFDANEGGLLAMAKESAEEFDFEIADQEWQYDPLADVEDQEGSEQEEDPGDFTGKPIESLAGRTEAQAPKKDARPEKPAAQRIEELFEKLNARRRVLSGILRFLEVPKSAAELNGEVERLQKHDFSVYTAANYAELLEEAGAIIKVDENGTPFADSPEQVPDIVTVDGADFLKPAPWREVYWLTTEPARARLAQNDPETRFRELMERDAQYKTIYVRILQAADCQEGATTPQLNELVDWDPLLKSPRLYTAHFTELLERCEALCWESVWKTTDIGRTLLAERGDETIEQGIEG